MLYPLFRNALIYLEECYDQLSVSKALDKSRNKPIVYSFCSIAVAILSTSCIMAC